MSKPKTKTIIYLLPGWGSDSTLLKPFARQLGNDLNVNYDVILLDLPWFKSVDIRAATADLITLARAVAALMVIEFVVIGWSLGGLVALQLAVLYPTRVLSLILLASTPCFLARENWPGIEPHFFTDFAGLLLKNKVAALRRFALLILQAVARTRVLHRAVRLHYAANSSTSTQLQLGLKILCETDLRQTLARLICPLHFILGAKDPLLPPTLREHLARLAPNSTTELIAGAGHLVFLTHTHATVSRIKALMATDVI